MGCMLYLGVFFPINISQKFKLSPSSFSKNKVIHDNSPFQFVLHLLAHILMLLHAKVVFLIYKKTEIK